VPQIVLQKLDRIVALRLGNNSLLTFPNLTSNTLQEIDMSLNKIPSLPPTITQLPYLRCLFLYGMVSSVIARPSLCFTDSYLGLDIESGNKLSRLPDEIGQLVRLEFIDISKNNLLDLPASIGNLTCLREILAFGNKCVSRSLFPWLLPMWRTHPGLFVVG
jgi:Leucine-rich repeat (LRR) protein